MEEGAYGSKCGILLHKGFITINLPIVLAHICIVIQVNGFLFSISLMLCSYPRQLILVHVYLQNKGSAAPHFWARFWIPLLAGGTARSQIHQHKVPMCLCSQLSTLMQEAPTWTPVNLYHHCIPIKLLRSGNIWPTPHLGYLRALTRLHGFFHHKVYLLILVHITLQYLLLKQFK